MTPSDPPKDSVLSSLGGTQSIKQEPQDPQPNLGSLGLQEITLDDGRNRPQASCITPDQNYQTSSVAGLVLEL